MDGLDLGLEKATSETTVVSKSKDKVVLRAKGMFHGVRENDWLDYRIVETFFNDGVVVLEVRLIPARDLEISKSIVHVAPGDKPLILKAGQEFSFRVGISVAPNRLPHPRAPELRMFIWIGDEKYPYPTDEENIL